MSIAYQKIREWVLVFVCACLVAFNFIHPAGVELYPVLDFQGGNQFTMATDKLVYHCGETVQALTIYQKQRQASGKIIWTLVRSDQNGNNYVVKTYPPRDISRPVGIYHEWRQVEILPDTCEPGRYHFEGVLTFDLWMGKAVYPLRTACFEMRKN